MEISPVDRQKLAERAKGRRIELGYSRKNLAEVISITPTLLHSWERELIKKPKPELEALWETALNVPKGWLRDISISTPDIAEDYALNLPDGATARSEIHTIATWLTRKAPAKRTIDRSDLKPIEQRNAEIFEMRYGYAGRDYTTLESIGEIYGLTRERVRQITDKMLSRTQGFEITAPNISSLQKNVNRMLPASVESLDGSCRTELGDKLSIYDLNRFCNEVLGLHLIYPHPIILGRPGETRTVVWADSKPGSKIEKELRQTRSTAIKMISNIGAAHMPTLVGLLSQLMDTDFAYSRTVALCKSVEGFQWLSEGAGWFWFGPKVPRRSRLVNAARKMLAASGGYQDKSSIYEGFLRTRRHFSQDAEQRRVQIEMPLEILGEVLKNTPGFVSKHYDDFSLESPISKSEVLGELEYEVLKVIENHGGIIARRWLLKEICEDQDVPLVSLQSVLERSPMIVYYQRSIYGIRGLPISPKALTTAIDESNLPVHISIESKEKYLSPGVNGEIEFTVRAGVNAVKVGSIILPAMAANSIPDGNYLIKGESREITITTVESGATYARLLLSKYKEKINIGDPISIKVFPEKYEIEIDVCRNMGH